MSQRNSTAHPCPGELQQERAAFAGSLIDDSTSDMRLSTNRTHVGMSPVLLMRKEFFGLHNSSIQKIFTSFCFSASPKIDVFISQAAETSPFPFQFKFDSPTLRNLSTSFSPTGPAMNVSSCAISPASTISVS